MKYIHTVIISVIFLLTITNVVTANSWWNESYLYRQEIVLTGNTSGAQTDYQILLNVTYDNDMQSDFDDLRVTNATQELDIWVQSKINAAYALMWVKFPTTPANGVEQSYYMYYGNETVLNVSNITQTFIFGDDFLNNTINTDKWEYDTGSVVVSGGIATLSGNNQKIHAKPNITLPFVIEILVKVSDDTCTGTSFGTGDMSHTGYPYTPNNGIFYYTRPTTSGDVQGKYLTDWMDPVPKVTVEANLGTYQIRKFIQTNSNIKVYYNNILEIDHSTDIPTVDMNIWFNTVTGCDILADWTFIRKYAINSPTYSFGDEEEPTAFYIPPNLSSLDYTTGNFWVNHAWVVGIGNITDSFNISINNAWINGTTATYNNTTYVAHAWQNITLWAYNSTIEGALSLGNISQNTQIPNNPITITNTSDWLGNVGETVYVDYDATDVDSDTFVFSCNRTDLFTDFDTVNGIGNWTATVNIYYVDFGVSDGYGSVSNYTMTLRELSIKPTTLLDELKLIMSEIADELSDIKMGDYLVYAFILIGILLIILIIQIINNGIYRG